jgi:hypothetical protein
METKCSSRNYLLFPANKEQKEEMKRSSMVRAISPKNRQRISEDPYYHKCARANKDCQGRITIEHALEYAGHRIDDMFALIPLCEWHHSVNQFQDGGGMIKKYNEIIAMARATKEEKKKYPNFKWSLYERNPLA